MPENNGPGDKNTQFRQFINERIIRQPLSRRELLRGVSVLFGSAVLFGVVAAVVFAAVRPGAETLFAGAVKGEVTPVTIPKDEPETAESTPAPTKEVPIEDILKSAMEEYPFSVDDLNALYGSLRSVVQQADKSIVTVHSVRTQTDWFNNPVENSGLFSGVVIAFANQELLVLVPDGAVEDAEAIRVTFSEGSEVQGRIKETDPHSGMAIVGISIADLGKTLLEEVKVLELGNSYSVKQGDMVAAVGGPAGVVHSVGYGFISYISKNVQVTDGVTRIFYADVKGNAATGTFLINTAGQIIGWVTDEFKNEGSRDMTAAIAISDYKSILERMSNGTPFPYFGIKGQEVTAVMNGQGMPLGVYVAEVNENSPAYQAGIQRGDIVTAVGKKAIVTMKDFQTALEGLVPGENAEVTVSRSGIEEYQEIQFQITIEAR